MTVSVGGNFLTPQKAADRAKVSRATVMNAVSSKALYAKRDNRNRWQIASADLEKWLSDREKSDMSASLSEPVSLQLENAELRGQLATVLGKLNGVEQALARSESDLASEKKALEIERAGRIEDLRASRKWWWQR